MPRKYGRLEEGISSSKNKRRADERGYCSKIFLQRQLRVVDVMMGQQKKIHMSLLGTGHKLKVGLDW